MFKPSGIHSHSSDSLSFQALIDCTVKCVIHELILYLANKAIPDKNGVLDILIHMVNADFMLGQRRRQLAYINPAS